MRLSALPILARAVCLALLACCAGHPPEPPKANSIVLCNDLAWGAVGWEKEAGKCLDHPIVVIVHGATLDGQWQAFPDKGPPLPVESMVRLVQKIFPGRPILLTCCNKDGLTLHAKHVWYARKLVSGIPHVGKPEWAEGIEDFEESK